MRGIVVVLALGLAVGGCVSGPAIDYMKAEYTGVPVKLHTVGDDEYRIFDKPDASKLMITPSIARAGGLGAAQAWGQPDQSHFTKPWSDAAESYLASTGRTCRIVSAELLASPQYEIKYECGPAKPAAATKRH